MSCWDTISAQLCTLVDDIQKTPQPSPPSCPLCRAAPKLLFPRWCSAISVHHFPTLTVKTHNASFTPSHSLASIPLHPLKSTLSTRPRCIRLTTMVQEPPHALAASPLCKRCSDHDATVPQTPPQIRRRLSRNASTSSMWSEDDPLDLIPDPEWSQEEETLLWEVSAYRR